MMTTLGINSFLVGRNIYVSDLLNNSKASEKYVVTRFTQDDGFTWETVVPYYSRWSALYIDSDEECAQYLISIKPYFTKAKMERWQKEQWKKWENNRGAVTKWIFKQLLSFKRENKFILPDGTFSDNPAKRIQDIKNFGYTVASVPSLQNKKRTDRILLPLPLNTELGYETYSNQFKNRVIRLLDGINAYEAKATTKGGLIPDHKFSEIRWDDETKSENPMTMSDEELIHKFQLLDNQRNQQKREVCRNCFQTGKRGTIYGIEYYFKGGPQWDESIPKQGKSAEKGCIGCPWYDIQAWRKHLNEDIKKINE